MDVGAIGIVASVFANVEPFAIEHSLGHLLVIFIPQTALIKLGQVGVIGDARIIDVAVFFVSPVALISVGAFVLPKFVDGVRGLVGVGHRDKKIFFHVGHTPQAAKGLIKKAPIIESLSTASSSSIIEILSDLNFDL